MKILKRIFAFFFITTSVVAQVDSTGAIQVLVFQECYNEGIKFRVKPITPIVDDNVLVEMIDESILSPNSQIKYQRLDKYSVFFTGVSISEQVHLQVNITRKGYPTFSYKPYSSACVHDGLPTNCPDNTRELTINRAYPNINQLVDVEWHGNFLNPSQFLSWYNANTSTNSLVGGKLFEGVLIDYPAVFHAQPSQRNQECHGWTELHISKKQPLSFEENQVIDITDFQNYIQADTLSSLASDWILENTKYKSNAFNQCKKAVKLYGNSSISNTSLNLENNFTIGMWVNAETANVSDSLGAVLISYLDDIGAKTDGFSIGLSPAGMLKLIARKKNITVNSSDGNIDLVASIPFNQWKYLTFTYDGMDLKVYVNGTLAERKTIGIGTPANKNLKFGNSIFGQHGFVGKLDEIKLFNRALTALDVQNLWVYSNQPSQDTALNLSSIVISAKTEGAEIISSTEIIQAGDVFYNANYSIDMLPGFDAKTLDVFDAKIVSCDN